MTLRQLIDRSLEFGLEVDYRGPEGGLRARQQEAQRVVELAGLKASTAQRVLRKWPVYGDTGLNVGALDRPIRRLLVGINMPAQAVLKAKQLNQQGWGIDLLFSHHPIYLFRGLPHQLQPYLLPSLWELDAPSLAQWYDLPLTAAQRIAELNHQVLVQWRTGPHPPPERSNITLELAQACDLPLYSCHTPCDNHLLWGIQGVLRQQPRTVGDFIEAVLAIPEYARFRRERLETPEVVAGSKRALLGKVWNADVSSFIFCLKEPVVAELAQVGFNTIVGVIGGAHGDIARFCRQHGLNAVHLPHDPSDNLGINGLLDKLVRVAPLDILCTGDFFRIQRG